MADNTALLALMFVLCFFSLRGHFCCCHIFLILNQFDVVVELISDAFYSADGEVLHISCGCGLVLQVLTEVGLVYWLTGCLLVSSRE